MQNTKLWKRHDDLCKFVATTNEDLRSGIRENSRQLEEYIMKYKIERALPAKTTGSAFAPVESTSRKKTTHFADSPVERQEVRIARKTNPARKTLVRASAHKASQESNLSSTDDDREVVPERAALEKPSGRKSNSPKKPISSSTSKQTTVGTEDSGNRAAPAFHSVEGNLRKVSLRDIFSGNYEQPNFSSSEDDQAVPLEKNATGTSESVSSTMDVDSDEYKMSADASDGGDSS